MALIPSVSSLFIAKSIAILLDLFFLMSCLSLEGIQGCFVYFLQAGERNISLHTHTFWEGFFSAALNAATSAD